MQSERLSLTEATNGGCIFVIWQGQRPFKEDGQGSRGGGHFNVSSMVFVETKW
jgi:hypothetical protein